MIKYLNLLVQLKLQIILSTMEYNHLPLIRFNRLDWQKGTKKIYVEKCCHLKFNFNELGEKLQSRIIFNTLLPLERLSATIIRHITFSYYYCQKIKSSVGIVHICQDHKRQMLVQ